MKKIDVTTMSKEDMIATREAIEDRAYDIYHKIDDLKATAEYIQKAVNAIEDIEDVFDNNNRWCEWYDLLKFLKGAIKDCDKEANELDEEYYQHTQAINSLCDAIDKEEEKEGA
jgi:alpha-L-arabinofuranosidase